MMERLIVVFITATAMCGTKASSPYHSFAEPRADPPNVKGHYSYSDPHGAIFHVTYETDKKSSSKTSPDRDRDYSDFGAFGSGKRNSHQSGANFNRPIYIVNTDNDEDAYNEKVNNYKITSTTKSPFKYGGFHFSTTPSPIYNSLPTSHKPTVKGNTNINANQGNFRPVMTKFTVNHPHPPPKQGNLISSRYQQYSYEDEDEYVDTKRDSSVNVAPVSDKYLSDYQQALSKLQAASSNIARRPNTPKSQVKKYNGIPPNVPSNYLGPKNKPSQKPLAADPDPKIFKPKFKLQNVPNLYPKDEIAFKPSMEFPDKVSPSKHKERFEPPPKYVYTNDNVQYYNVDGGAIPPSKSQSPQQYLKRQNQVKLQQQMIMEKMKKSRTPYGYGQASQTNFRPIVPQQPQHRFSAPRRKPSRAFTPAAARTPYKSRPLIDGPYSIRISM